MLPVKSEEKSPLKVLVSAMFGIGHLNACLGIASLFKKRGHQVYFAHYPENRSSIEKQGCHFINLLDYHPIKVMNGENVLKIVISEFKKASKFAPLEQLKEDIKNGFNTAQAMTALFENAQGENHAMLKIIEELQPDVCLADYLFPLPWMFSVSCPAIRVWSTNPVDLYNGPPMGSGYSVHSSSKLWEEHRSLQEKLDFYGESKIKELFQLFNVEYKSRFYVEQLGVYIYPGPMDYKELGQPLKNWVRLDASIRLPESVDFPIDAKIKDKPGKLIYLSLGTLASSVSDLMTMLLTPLATSPHRFIVSTGPKGDSIKLYDNMWGDKFINQLALLPKVDLFITHGGSNSLIEGLVAGKPLIVIPLFADQPDNAQRIEDLGLGVKINLWDFSGDKLLKAIDHVLNDEKIHSNVSRISEEVKKSDSSDEVISLIEDLARAKETSL